MRYLPQEKNDSQGTKWTILESQDLLVFHFYFSSTLLFIIIVVWNKNATMAVPVLFPCTVFPASFFASPKCGAHICWDKRRPTYCAPTPTLHRVCGPANWSVMRPFCASFSILKGKTAKRVKESNSCSSMELFEELHQTQRIIFQLLASQ